MTMNTPRKPSFRANFAKTPFQKATQRPFRSEAQPNRVSNSRFAYTSQRPTTNKSSLVISRLANHFKSSKPPEPTQSQHQTQTALQPRNQSILQPRNQPVPLPQNLPSLQRRNEPAPIPQNHPILQPRNEPAPILRNEPVPLTRNEPVPPQQHQPVPLPQTQSVSQPRTQPISQPRLQPVSQPRTQQKTSRLCYAVTVNGKSYKIQKKIGTGGFSVVYEGFEPELSQTVAIKIISMASADANTRRNYSNELDLLKRLKDCDHVVKMFDCEFRPDINELLIVMEKGDADLTELMNLDFRKDGYIKGCVLDSYWVSMVEAVNEIHKHGVVHADLKPDNFIRIKNSIKLIDFGIADRLDPDLTSVIKDYQIGTVNYMAPEALRNRALDASFQLKNNGTESNKTVIKYNSKADIWSLGCILYHLVYGQPPYYKYKDILSKVNAITQRDHKIDFPTITDEKLLQTLKSCLKYNPDERPTSEELLNDVYTKATRAPKFSRPAV